MAPAMDSEQSPDWRRLPLTAAFMTETLRAGTPESRRMGAKRADRSRASRSAASIDSDMRRPSTRFEAKLICARGRSDGHAEDFL